MVFGNSKCEVSKMRLRVLYYEFVYDDKLKRTFFFFLFPVIAIYMNPLILFLNQKTKTVKSS